MKLIRIAAVAAVLAGTVSGCIIRTPPCHHDCWWSHGRRICERRCY
jgi:hypothetical protein